jgi:hypothetical protein
VAEPGGASAEHAAGAASWASPARWRKLRPTPVLLLTAWAGVALVALSSLAVPHMAPMPQAQREARLAGALLELRTERRARFLVHVIAADCSCTQRLFEHLLARGPFAGAEEVIVFVGEDAVKRDAATRAGFRYTTLDAAELARRFGLESAPVLFAFDGESLRYAGGYFNHPSTLVALDADIAHRVTAGESPPPLPVYGCAVSDRLRKAVDPLGIVYPRS